MTLDRFTVNYRGIAFPKRYLHIGLRNQPFLRLDECAKVGVSAGLPYNPEFVYAARNECLYDMKSTEYLSNFDFATESKFDMVFVNGLTDFKSSLADAKVALKVVKSDGIVVINNSYANGIDANDPSDVWKTILYLRQTEKVRVVSSAYKSGFTVIAKCDAAAVNNDLMALRVECSLYKVVKDNIDTWLNVQTSEKINEFLVSLKHNDLSKMLADNCGINLEVF